MILCIKGRKREPQFFKLNFSIKNIIHYSFSIAMIFLMEETCKLENQPVIKKIGISKQSG